MEQHQSLFRKVLDRLGFNKGRAPRGPAPIHQLRQYDRMIDNVRIARGEVDEHGRRIPRDERPW